VRYPVATEGWVQFTQGRREAFEIRGRSTVTEIDIVRDARAAECRRRLTANDKEFHAMRGEQPRDLL
jgi:hypothetical protein